MKLPKFLAVELNKLRPFEGYMRNQVIASGNVPSGKFPVLVAQFVAITEKDANKNAGNKNFKKIYDQSVLYTTKLITYLRSVDKLPSDAATGAAAGFSFQQILPYIQNLFNPQQPQQPQQPVAPPPQKINTTDIILIGGVLLLIVVLIVK